MANRMIMKAAIIPVILALVLITAIYWRSLSLEQANREYSEQSRQLQRAYAELGSAGQLQEKNADLEKRLADLRGDLYGLDEAVELVKYISRQAGNYEVLLNDFKFDLPWYIDQKNRDGDPGPFIVPFECVLQGDYIKIGKFIAGIEKRKFIGDIVNVKFYRDTSGKAAVICELKGALRFFDKSILESKADEKA
jgi:Tfp pilus assembly protein PilO